MDDLFEFDKEGLNDVYLDLESGVVNSEFSELHEDGFEVNSDLGIKFLVSGFLDCVVDSTSDTESFFLYDFMDVL